MLSVTLLEGYMRQKCRCVLVLSVFLGIVGLVECVVGQEYANFTVASIKPSADNFPGMVIRPLGNGGYSAQKVVLLALLTSAYGISPQRIVGLPNWGNTDRYDIEARYERRDRPAPQLNLLLQGLLRSRFALAAHMEKRDFPVYFLRTIAKDGKPGTGLKRSQFDCSDSTTANSPRQNNQRAPNGAAACTAIEWPGAFIAGGVTMDSLTRSIRIPAGRDVINETGLPGNWEFSLEFAPPGDTSGDKPDIFTAIKDQLGLRLDSGTGPLEVLVIDSVARPTAN